MFKTKVSCSTHKETNEQREPRGLLNVKEHIKRTWRRLDIKFQAAAERPRRREWNSSTQPNTAPSLTRKLTGKVTATWFCFSPLLKLFPNLVIVLLREGHRSQGFRSWRTANSHVTQIKWIGVEGFTSFGDAQQHWRGETACLNHIGAPIGQSASRSHTRLMTAHSVHQRHHKTTPANNPSQQVVPV